MAAATPATHDAMIKHLYPDPNEILKAMYENNTAFALIKKNFGAYGKNWHRPIRIAHTAGRSHTFANAKANKAGSTVVEFQINAGTNYSLYSVDGKLQRQTSNNKGAFVEAFEFELDAAMDAMNRNFGYEVYGNGGGAIGQISGASNVNTNSITLANINDIVKFEKGQVLGVAATDGTTGTVKPGTVTVQALDRDAGIVTVAGGTWAGLVAAANNSNGANGDYIFPDGDFGLGIKGFSAWIPAVTPTPGDNFFLIDRSIDGTRLAGSRVDARTLGPEEAVQKACQVALRNGGKISHFFYNDVDFLNLELALGSRRLYADTNTDVGIGFTGVRVATGTNGFVEIYPDYNCPQGVAFGVDLKQWQLSGPGQFPFVDARDGNKLLREDTADAFEGRVVGYYQLESKKVAGSVRLQLV